MCVCMNGRFMYDDVYICMNARLYDYVYIHMNDHMYICMNDCLYDYVYICMNGSMCAYVGMVTRLSMFTNVRMAACTNIWNHKWMHV